MGGTAGGVDGAESGNATLKLSESFKQGMRETLRKSPHSSVKALYSQYESQLTVKETNHPNGAFYRPGEGVYMNVQNVAKGDMIHEPYQTAFHEFGHNIDYIMGDGSPISEKWGDNALYEAIKSDYELLKGNRSDSQMIADIKAQMHENGWSIKDMASASDIIESMSGVSYPLGAGHGCDYWSGRLPNKEFFAETLDGAAANERSYSILKRFFPNAVRIVHQIIGGAGQ